jgi:hypothetical protein
LLSPELRFQAGGLIAPYYRFEQRTMYWVIFESFLAGGFLVRAVHHLKTEGLG